MSRWLLIRVCKRCAALPAIESVFELNANYSYLLQWKNLNMNAEPTVARTEAAAERMVRGGRFITVDVGCYHDQYPTIHSVVCICCIDDF